MKTDWVAEMFRALRDCGENISIVYAQRNGAQTQTDLRWFELPHDQYDGISGLGQLLREQGLRVEKLPVLRNDRFTFWRGLRGFFTVLPAVKVRRQQWKSEFGWSRKVSSAPARERVAWHLFTEEQTREIVAAAKAAGVTVNTYLLLHLDAAVSAELVPPGTSRRWMIPVNLRGAVTRPAELPPHMSFLGVDLEDAMTLDRLQAQIDRLKERCYHWGMWILLHLGRLLGAEGMRQDIRKRERQEHGVTGMFSNLGTWDIPGSGSWIFCPAITRVYPVGAGCITMNGRMGLAMQLHDALGKDLQTSYALLEAWASACLPESSRGAVCSDSNPRVANA
ncbi:MAG TPA: hypothetical protein VEC06_06590 [Paucimonas sp.]|nr:hypothetical protein [Paucimonas sp.]